MPWLYFLLVSPQDADELGIRTEYRVKVPVQRIPYNSLHTTLGLRNIKGRA